MCAGSTFRWLPAESNASLCFWCVGDIGVTVVTLQSFPSRGVGSGPDLLGAVSALGSSFELPDEGTTVTTGFRRGVDLIGFVLAGGFGWSTWYSS